MKAFFLCGMLLLAGIQVLPNTPDTTVTNFEIHLKKKSAEYFLGFNSCSIDRLKLYNSVMNKIRKKLPAEQFQSLYQPLVTLKFHEYNTEKESRARRLSRNEKKALASHNYDYYIKVSGHLNPSTPLDPFRRATVKLKVYVFDSSGNLIAKSRGTSSGKNLNAFYKTSDQEISEEEFIDLVSQAAEEVRFKI